MTALLINSRHKSASVVVTSVVLTEFQGLIPALTLLVGRQEGHLDWKNPASAIPTHSPLKTIGGPSLTWSYLCRNSLNKKKKSKTESESCNTPLDKIRWWGDCIKYATIFVFRKLKLVGRKKCIWPIQASPTVFKRRQNQDYPWWLGFAAARDGRGMAHSDCGWTCGCACKSVRSLENTCHTWALLRWFHEEVLYQSVRMFTFTIWW